MGKLRPRLASKKKAKRWAKGQSSSSNPTTTKHREQARGMFFKDVCGTPGITKEDLRKHDALQGIESDLAELEVDEDQSEKTAYTSTTFATNYSNCSNVSFKRFLNHFQSSSIVHKEMLAVLAAVTEVLKQNNGNKSATEYFAVLMTTLEAVEDDTSVAATLSLFGMNLKTVPKSVLIRKFGVTSQVLLEILSKYTVSENYLVVRHCLGCLSILLRAQEAAAWTDSSTVRALDAILSFITHTKPKPRKSAQHGICAILKGSELTRGENPPSLHPAAGQIATYCITQLDSACKPGSPLTTTLHTLTLLKDIMHQLPKSHVKTTCERILSIMTLKNVLVTSCCLQTLHGLFVSRPSETTLPLQRNVDIITALYDYQPPVSDTQPTLAWLAVMQEAHCNLVYISSAISRRTSEVGTLLDYAIPKILKKCIELWLSDKTEVISGAFHAIKIIFQECVAFLCENEQRIKTYNLTLSEIIKMMRKTLSYQYVNAWQHIFHLIALLFQITGKPKLSTSDLIYQYLRDIVKSLGELRDSHNFAYNSDAEYAIGAAIRAMGPEAVLNVLPLRTDDSADDSADDINVKRGWMIPLLKDCVTSGSISFFERVLLPIIEICEERMKDPVSGKTYEFLVPQIWSILPSVCNDASDVKDNFNRIAKRLGTTIKDRQNLKLPVMTALRRLITRATQDENAADIAVLAYYAKNYLPILFNLYTTRPSGTDEEGQRLAALDTIKVYITITSSELANELFDNALRNFNNPDANTFLKESIHDLIRVLIGYADVTKLKVCYGMYVSFLKDNAKQKEQKKAYRFLEEVCASDKEVCKQFLQERRRDIQKVLISSATSVVKTSRGARLACLVHLVTLHPQLENTKFLQAIVPEVVLSVKDINERCRNTAYRLLNVIAEKFLDNSKHLKDYMDMLIVGLGGEQKYVSATLLALASLTYHHGVSLGTETISEILKHVRTILNSPTRECVESALSYVKVYITVIRPSVAELQSIIEALSQINEDCKRHFRQKIRDIFTKLIRKYAMESISSMLPISDTILHKRLKNINKIENAKRKERELERMKKRENDEEFNAKRKPKSIEDILADSDEEFEKTEKEEPRKNKKISKRNVWIQENQGNIVNLADLVAARNITTTQPGVSNPKSPVKKVKDYGFKTAPDGRLIITDDNDRDSDVEKTNKKKRKASFLQSDSEDDNADEDDASIVTAARTAGVKRAKHSESVSDVMSLKSQTTSKYQAGGSGIHRPLRAKKEKRKERVPGSEYRAVKAKGDIKKKGKPDPYVYLPFTRSVLNKSLIEDYESIRGFWITNPCYF
ncbi:RRP12-like protein [Ooceraea biroi]|uniref:RRP12-like protein n=1 Tax=Ooceraea biroi TaxID=2015173 RepID=A0A026VVB6_OOCBI|nr:RRP12-like protein [Ooceraea biroi]